MAVRNLAMEKDALELPGELLARVTAGDHGAQTTLFELVYAEMRRRAHFLMRSQPADHCLQTTALVHEAWLKLRGREDVAWSSRLHFLKAATTAMRSILVDHARSRATEKRGGDRARVSLEGLGGNAEGSAETVLALDDALRRLKAIDEELAQTAELKLFSALELDEIAEALGVSRRTAARAWSLARAWLQNDLGG